MRQNVFKILATMPEKLVLSKQKDTNSCYCGKTTQRLVLEVWKKLIDKVDRRFYLDKNSRFLETPF